MNFPLTQQSAVSEANSPHSSQNRENSAPGTACETLSMAAGELSPGHVTSVSGDLQSADQMGLSAGGGPLRHQGTDYTILDESPPEQAVCVSQGDPILELVAYPEALQLVLSRQFGDFASLRFDFSGQPQVVFHSVGQVQPSRQSARAPPHSVSTSTPQAAAQSQAGAPSVVYSSPMDLSVGAPPPQTPWSSGLVDPRLVDWAPITLLHLPWFPFVLKGISVTRQGLRTPEGTTVPRCVKIGWIWPTISWLVETGRQPNYLPPPWTKPRARSN